MKIRRSVVALSAAVGILSGVLVLQPTASADPVPDADVAGGASALEIHSVIELPRLFSLLYPEQGVTGWESFISEPVVLLPDNGNGGGPFTTSAAGQDISGISVHGLRVSTVGSRAGDPFAASSATIAHVGITGTTIRAIHTECRWDRFGEPTATTLLTDVAGTVYTPAPNTTINLPGLGYAVLNEQDTDELSSGARVIWVKGVHVHLSRYIRNSNGVVKDVSLAFSSCDPNNLPTLTDLLRLVAPST